MGHNFAGWPYRVLILLWKPQNHLPHPILLSLPLGSASPNMHLSCHSSAAQNLCCFSLLYVKSRSWHLKPSTPSSVKKLWLHSSPCPMHLLFQQDFSTLSYLCSSHTEGVSTSPLSPKAVSLLGVPKTSLLYPGLTFTSRPIISFIFLQETFCDHPNSMDFPSLNSDYITSLTHHAFGI